MRITFTLNGEDAGADLPPQTTLLEYLRDLGIRSIMSGCDRGTCGSCLVLLDGQAVPSCLVPVFQIRDRQVETVEGLMNSTGFADLERGFQSAGYQPCAWCVSSKIILAESLLRSDLPLDDVRMRAVLPRDWCNCTSRENFLQAVTAARETRSTRQGRRGH